MRALLLDFDDTLISSSRERRPLLESELRAWGASNSQISDVRDAWGKPFDELIAPAISEHDRERFIAHYRERMTRVPIAACPGAIELLHTSQVASLPVYVVSSSRSELVKQDLEAIGVGECVSGVFGAGETQFHKPDPRVFNEISAELMSRHGFSLSSCVFVGDSLGDYMSSRDQCRFFAVLTGETTKDQFVANGLDAKSILPNLEVLTADIVSGRIPIEGTTAAANLATHAHQDRDREGS